MARKKTVRLSDRLRVAAPEENHDDPNSTIMKMVVAALKMRGDTRLRILRSLALCDSKSLTKDDKNVLMVSLKE